MEKQIKCKSCGNELASNTICCPICGTKTKKPIYKKWWFWAIVAIVIIAISSSGGGNEPVSSGENNNISFSNEQAAQTNKAEEKGFKNGMYKIGTDIPAGEYVIVSSSSTYMAITSDSTGTLDSIIANDNFKNRSIVTVADGQYLEFNSGRAYPISDAPAVDTSSGVLSEGMYKAGVDFPAGEYKVVASGGMGYVEISNDSSHELLSIISNDNFDGEKYITISDGQYLKMNRCSLQLQ